MTQGRSERERQSRPENSPETSSVSPVRAATVTRRGFSAGFELCFGRVYAYVSWRVSDRETCERIVSEVLEAHLDLLADQRDERHELCQLKAATDRLIGLDSARILSTGTTGP